MACPAWPASGQSAFLLSRDGEAAVIAHFIEEGEPGEAHGVHTHNPVIVHLIEGYVHLAAQNNTVPGASAAPQPRPEQLAED